MNIVTIVGARPQFIKPGPVSAALHVALKRAAPPSRPTLYGEGEAALRIAADLILAQPL